MKKQAVARVMFIFLFFCFILYAGLTLAERSLEQLVGNTDGKGSFALYRDRDSFILTFGGRSYRFGNPFKEVLKAGFIP